jgi:hypothetical protein
VDITSARPAAVVFGALYVLLAAAGFVVAGLTGGGTLLVLAVSPLLNVVHLIVGLLGIGASTVGQPTARLWAQLTGAVFGLAAVLGVVISNPLGAVPIGGFAVLVHGLTAVVLLYVGYAESEEAQETTAT